MWQMKNSSFKETFSPVIVLVVICLVTTLALAGTYSVANPMIIKNQKAAADEARKLVLPEGDSFTQYDGDLAAGVVDCYMADNGAGMTVTAGAGGYGGTVEVMIGLDAEGAITGVTVTSHSETPGLGTKAMTTEYLAQYKGVSEVAGDDIRNDGDIDAISGATLTSDAVYVAVGAALDQFKECGGVN